MFTARYEINFYIVIHFVFPLKGRLPRVFNPFLSCNIRLSTQNTILFIRDTELCSFLINQLSKSKYFELELLRCKY